MTRGMSYQSTPIEWGNTRFLILSCPDDSNMNHVIKVSCNTFYLLLNLLTSFSIGAQKVQGKIACPHLWKNLRRKRFDKERHPIPRNGMSRRSSPFKGNNQAMAADVRHFLPKPKGRGRSKGRRKKNSDPLCGRLGQSALLRSSSPCAHWLLAWKCYSLDSEQETRFDQLDPGKLHHEPEAEWQQERGLRVHHLLNCSEECQARFWKGLRSAFSQGRSHWRKPTAPPSLTILKSACI